jgi:hypothetical protein
LFFVLNRISKSIKWKSLGKRAKHPSRRGSQHCPRDK